MNFPNMNFQNYNNFNQQQPYQNFNPNFQNNYTNNNNNNNNYINFQQTFQSTSQNINFNNNNNNINNNKMNDNTEINSKYLISRKLKDISNEEFTDFISSLNIEGLKDLKQKIENFKFSDKKVGEFNTLGHLVEKFYGYKPERHNTMIKKYKSFTQDIFKHRTIYGDGNCFYRSVLFSYLEQLILFKELNTIKNFIFDVKAFLISNQVKSILDKLDERPKLDSKLILRILVLFYLGVKNNKIKDTYSLLVKAFNNLDLFDQGLIMYLRFCLFRYIKENENKLYSKQFEINLGNLLPEQFETKEGKFLFNDFYYKFLLKPGKLAEKIIIYITPYVLCTKLEVVMFEMEDDSRKSFNFIGEKNTVNDLNTVIIYLPGHYELIYTREFYQRFYNVFKNYSDFSYKNEIMTEIKEEQRNKNESLLDMDSEITSSGINNNNNQNYFFNNYNNISNNNCFNNNGNGFNININGNVNVNNINFNNGNNGYNNNGNNGYNNGFNNNNNFISNNFNNNFMNDGQNNVMNNFNFMGGNSGNNMQNQNQNIFY